MLGKHKILKFVFGVLCLQVLFCTGSTHATSSLSVALSPSIDLEVLPTAEGATSFATTNLAITTQNTAGYKVLISSTNSTLANNFHPETITSITTPTALNALPTNHWGIYLGGNTPSSSTLFQPISTTPTEFAKSDLADASGTYKLSLAARADTSLPAGVYANQIIVSVVASPSAETRSMADIEYMQDISPQICANSELEVTYTLTDKRDNKSYKVAKLKDGNCWMQEDLKLILSASRALTPEDSDTNRIWTPKNTNTKVTASSDNNGVESWYLGGRMYYQWVAATAGTGAAASAGDEASDSLCAKGWQLPVSGADNHDEPSSFYLLLSKYNALNSVNIAESAPLNFLPNGFVYNGDYNGLTQPDIQNNFWARDTYANDNIKAHAMRIFFNAMHPTSGDERFAGFAMRCVAPGVTE